MAKEAEHSHALNFPHEKNHELNVSVLALSHAISGRVDVGKVKLFLSLFITSIIGYFCPKHLLELLCWMPTTTKVLLSMGDCQNSCSVER